jgi:phosphate transport system substrate-binding protein
VAYAIQNKLPYAAIRNANGKFVQPTLEAISDAAEGAVKKLGAGTDYRISIVNAPGKNAYPISSFTWLLVYKNQADVVKSKKLTEFMKWAFTEGEKSAPSLNYAPLPKSVVSDLLKRMNNIQVSSK